MLEILKSDSAAPDLRAVAAQVLGQLGGRAAEENAALIEKLVTTASEGAE